MIYELTFICLAQMCSVPKEYGQIFTHEDDCKAVAELETWVLSRPINIESVRYPREWWPVPPARHIIGKFGIREE